MPEYYVTTNILEDKTGKQYFFGEKAPKLSDEQIEVHLAKGTISKKKPGEVIKPEDDEIDLGVLQKAPFADEPKKDK